MSTCQRCGTEFTCGMSDAPGSEPCWCTTLPPLAPERYEGNGCYCPQCLRACLAAAGEDGKE